MELGQACLTQRFIAFWQTAPSFREGQGVECNVAMAPSSAYSDHENPPDLHLVSEPDETQLGNILATGRICLP